MTAEWGVRWPDDDAVEEHDTQQAAHEAAGTCGQVMHNHDGGPWTPAPTSEETPVNVVTRSHRATPTQRVARAADLIDVLFAYLLYALAWTAGFAGALWIPITAFTRPEPAWAVNLISAALIVILALGLMLAAALAARGAMAAHQRILDGQR